MSHDGDQTTAVMPAAGPSLGLIVAMSENRCIGRDGKLPWHLPEDMRHFRQATLGHAVIMGRKTFESIGTPLKQRRNIVLSGNPTLQIEGCEIAPTFEAGVALARQTDPMPIVIGGAAVYAKALPWVTTLYLTEVHRQVDGDTFFPALDPATWHELERKKSSDGQCSFVKLERA